jgi:hypothetical protein
VIRLRKYYIPGLLFVILFPIFYLIVFNLRVQAVFLYEHETWSLALSVKQASMVVENRMLRKISGPRKVKVNGTLEKHMTKTIICTVLLRYWGA